MAFLLISRDGLNNPFGFICARAEGMHQELLKACGGASDSDGITYLSDASDEAVPKFDSKQPNSSQKRKREEDSKETKQPVTKSSKIASGALDDGFVEDAREEQQEGWNCFDVAAGFKRSELVAFALQHAGSEECRRLLAPEIRNAAVITAILMNLQSQEEEASLQKASQIRELFALLDAANQFGEEQDQQPIMEQIEELFLGEDSDQPNLARFALPESMRTLEVQVLVNQYNNAHEMMRNAVAQCNTSLGYGEGHRKSLAELDEFFSNTTNRQQYQAVYEVFAKARAELFTPHEEAFFQYSQRLDVYQSYVGDYYGQNQWMAFQPSSTHHIQTSMVDIAARFLKADIVLHQKNGLQRKVIYSTNIANTQEIHIQFNGYGHFVALARKPANAAQPMGSVGFMPSPRAVPMETSSSVSQNQSMSSSFSLADKGCQ